MTGPMPKRADRVVLAQNVYCPPPWIPHQFKTMQKKSSSFCQRCDGHIASFLGGSEAAPPEAGIFPGERPKSDALAHLNSHANEGKV